MKRLSILTLALFCLVQLSAQTESGYKFTDVIRLPATSVKNQASTGTCWCFATTSFMESELLRKGKGEHDLSEMYIVRYKYINQLNDNYLRQGKGNLGQGSLSHTFKNVYKDKGILPEEIYSGINYDSKSHNHSELNSMIGAIAAPAIKSRKRTPEYYKLIDNTLDTYLGAVPATFTYKGKEYTPESFTASLGLDMDDYVEIGSFTHKPYYTSFVLEVPDNWEAEPIYNIPLNELMQTMDYALEKGYTFCWDGDVSERGFSHGNGFAINPELVKVEDMSQTDRARLGQLPISQRSEEVFKFERPYAEVKVTPEVRQAGYESFTTTDDHLMHVTGVVKDQNGTKYYITKNSWGPDSKLKGYLNMSESYVRAKVLFIMLHKDAIPAAIKAKLNIK